MNVRVYTCMHMYIHIFHTNAFPPTYHLIMNFILIMKIILRRLNIKIDTP
jgi:hypothetical protein